LNDILKTVIGLGSMGLFFGVGLAYASKKFAVESDPKIEAINNALPGANCGGCGYPGCAALAQAIANGEAAVNACPVGGSETAGNIAAIMGVQADAMEKRVAHVICKGDCKNAHQKADYQGIHDCKAAVLANNGQKSCSYGCLGFGTCKNVCDFGAISIVDGIAVIDKDKCVACGKCLEQCPKSIIKWVPYKQEVIVECNSHEFGKEVKDKCKVGCIGCGICQKVCPFDAVHVIDKLAIIDYEKCKQCHICPVKCPTSAISGNPEKMEKVRKAQEKKNAAAEKADEK